jgi:hypothetical protein
MIMAASIDPKQIAELLAEIPNLSRADLVERWSTDHDRLPPKGISRRLLEYSAAYQVQVKAFGGLKPAVIRKLRLSVKRIFPLETSVVPTKAKTLKAGTRLVREWRGRTYTVDTHENGFQFEGEHYASLSKVAHVITGARWSGPRFFGL